MKLKEKRTNVAKDILCDTLYIEKKGISKPYPLRVLML